MFNYQQALQAGASEDQVIEYLTKTRKYNVQGALQAGASKKQIIEYLANTTPKQEQPKEKSKLEKVADFGLKITGAKAGSKLLQPIFNSLTAFNSLTPNKLKEKVLLGKSDELTGKMETQGFKSVAKDIVGSTAELASTLMPVASQPATALGRIGVGTAIGTLSGISNPLQENKSFTDVRNNGITGAVIGLVTSGIFESLGKYGQSRMNQTRTSDTFNKELQPDVKKLQQQIKNTPIGEQFKSVGLDVKNAVDINGKPLFRGTYTQMEETAKKEAKRLTPILNSQVAKYDDTVSINRSEVAGDIIKTMQRQFGQLKPSELKTIMYEVNQLPKNMTPTQALEWKRTFQQDLSDNILKFGADKASTLPSATKLYLKNKLNDAILTKTADPTIRELNRKLSLAINVQDLSSFQIAQRKLTKIGAENGGVSFWRALQGLIDDTILNPAITTRIAGGGKSSLTQGIGLTNLGKNVGQGPLRGQLIKGISNIFNK